MLTPPLSAVVARSCCFRRGSTAAAVMQALLTEDSEWSAVANLDAFFSKVYTYYVEKGFWCMITARITNLLSVARARTQSKGTRGAGLL